MRVLVVDNVHLFKAPDGHYYSNSIYSYDFLSRYLRVFDEVSFIGKTRHVDEIDEISFMRVDGPGVVIVEIPWYQGLTQLLQNALKVIKAFSKSIDGCDCAIFRIAQLESFGIYSLGGRKLPFAVEVVNDPETFEKGIVRSISVAMVKRMSRKAIGASYVTKDYLQNKYPSRARLGDSEAFETHYSSIELKSEDIRREPRLFQALDRVSIVHVANAINDDSKGHVALIKALPEIIARGIDADIRFIGDGCLVEDLKQLAVRLQVSDRVEFLGRFTDKSDIYAELSHADMMVLPTRMEGLPRTIIEAMAVGLPCISTPIAGIPELLDRRYLFDPDDYLGFAEEVVRLARSPQEMSEMSAMGIAKAGEYESAILQDRRLWFYKKLKESTEGGRR